MEENSMITLQEIEWASEAYVQEVSLRNAVLREPLGLSFTQAEKDAEPEKIHFGAFRETELTGCVLIQSCEADEWKLSQMAVDPDCQGQGIGRRLVAIAEEVCRSKGGLSLVLNARVSAWRFYESCGYSRESDEFILVGIPHVVMRKELSV